jgi:hypothetical protein
MCGFTPYRKPIGTTRATWLSLHFCATSPHANQAAGISSTHPVGERHGWRTRGATPPGGAIDIGKKIIAVAIRTPGERAGKRLQQVRKYNTYY